MWNSTFKPRKKSLRQYSQEKALRSPAKPPKPRTAIKSRPKPQTGSQPQMARKAGLKRTPLRKVSSARAIANRVYSDKRRVFMLENPSCQAGLEGCEGRATECHHTNGREGKNFLDVSTWKSLCSNCHRFVHQFPNMARELGLLR